MEDEKIIMNETENPTREVCSCPPAPVAMDSINVPSATHKKDDDSFLKRIVEGGIGAGVIYALVKGGYAVKKKHEEKKLADERKKREEEEKQFEIWVKRFEAAGFVRMPQVAAESTPSDPVMETVEVKNVVDEDEEETKKKKK